MDSNKGYLAVNIGEYRQYLRDYHWGVAENSQ